MQFQALEISDVVLIGPEVFQDATGHYFASWERRQFAAAGITAEFVQENESRCWHHILRGLHYQIEQPQGKLVRTVIGTVFNVAVDIRRSSRTFGRWVSAVLSEENHQMLWIPSGFAHGFLVLSEDAHVVCRCTHFWAPSHERSILWKDPEIKVEWPIPTGTEPLVSAKDGRAQPFRLAPHFP